MVDALAGPRESTSGRRAQPLRATSRRRSRQRSRQNGAALLFLAPWLLGLVGITLVPMAISLYLSFTDFNLIRFGTKFVGLDNYLRMASDSRLLASAKVTAVYVLFSVPLQLVFALLLALLLNQGLRGLSIYRAVYYLPSLLGGSVAVGLLWRRVFGGDGLLNQVLGLLGLTNLPSWIGDPDYALWTLIIHHAWTFGSPMVIFLAGLRQIPSEIYESAAVDGAGLFARLFRITLPLLSPVIFFNLVLQVINAFQAFTPAYVISGGTGGPNDSTLFYTLYLYTVGFRQFDMGRASAMAWMLLAVIAAFTAVNFLTSRKWVFYGDE
ncbi:carbohydrate ABC transporter permease [Microlunatus antarcticus]|uniref:Multiple sugar transport system permease protein n=1 Tax=Microlunatus antarcticus TaxID=53388 RepID=A0A7W5JZK1_9ACTN|nr:sugar ABC transporter permease [Microlunatus antarcticus]MBB3329148.1 multiple sugar transport system permease protein [Microlunatus antarcticus]